MVVIPSQNEDFYNIFQKDMKLIEVLYPLKMRTSTTECQEVPTNHMLLYPLKMRTSTTRCNL